MVYQPASTPFEMGRHWHLGVYKFNRIFFFLKNWTVQEFRAIRIMVSEKKAKVSH